MRTYGTSDTQCIHNTYCMKTFRAPHSLPDFWMGGYLRSEYYTFCEKKFLLVFTSSDETSSSMVIQVHQDIGDTGYIQIQIISRDLDDTGIIGATVGQIHWDSDLDDTHHWDSRVIIEGSGHVSIPGPNQKNHRIRRKMLCVVVIVVYGSDGNLCYDLTHSRYVIP